MSKVVKYPFFSPTQLGDETRFNELVKAIDNVSFGDATNNIKAGNIDAVYVEFTSSATPDAENTIPHKLGRVPRGIIVVMQDKAASVYKGTTAWTSSNIYLKVNTASVTIKLLVF